MNEKRVTFDVATADGTHPLLAVEVASNIAIHRPFSSPYLGGWDVSQMSSGKRLGRFGRREEARAYAQKAVALVPALVAGSPLEEDDVVTLFELREKMGGRKE